MKQTAKRLIGSAVFIALAIALTLGAGQILKRKAADYKYASFYAQDEDFDVLFFGTSHVIDGIFPTTLWHDHGIVSYNFGGHANLMPVTYWQMVNALDYTTPQLIVLDCAGIRLDHKMPQTTKHIHLSFDAVPLSLHKVQAVCDLMEDRAERMEFLWTTFIYHDRWSELTDDDFRPAIGVEMGAEKCGTVAVPRTPAADDRTLKMSQDALGVQYLRRFILDCQERDIPLLLTYLPYPVNKDELREVNTVADIAAEYGVDYLDYYTLKEQVDFDTDCHDADSHLNTMGGLKVTRYIGQYIRDHYAAVPDQRENERYAADWDRQYDAHLDDTIALLAKPSRSRNSYLMLLYEENLRYSFYLDPERLPQDDAVFSKLMNSLGVDLAALSLTEPAVVTVDAEGAVSVCGLGATVSTSWGAVALEDTADGERVMRVDGEDVLTVTDRSLGIVVFDRRTGDIAAKKAYS